MMHFMNGFSLERLAVFLAPMARVILRGYRSMPTTAGAQNTAGTVSMRPPWRAHAFAVRTGGARTQAVAELLAVSPVVEGLDDHCLAAGITARKHHNHLAALEAVESQHSAERRSATAHNTRRGAARSGRLPPQHAAGPRQHVHMTNPHPCVTYNLPIMTVVPAVNPCAAATAYVP